jgi:hypothetical protein
MHSPNGFSPGSIPGREQDKNLKNNSKMKENANRPGRKKTFDTRENQIRKYERNIKSAGLFLSFLRSNDISKINGIVLLFDREIKDCIGKYTRDTDEQNECYQFTAYTFMDMCSHNAVTSTNLEGYLCGIARNYFHKKREEKKRRKEVEFNEAFYMEGGGKWL